MINRGPLIALLNFRFNASSRVQQQGADSKDYELRTEDYLGVRQRLVCVCVILAHFELVFQLTSSSS